MDSIISKYFIETISLPNLYVAYDTVVFQEPTYSFNKVHNVKERRFIKHKIIKHNKYFLRLSDLSLNDSGAIRIIQVTYELESFHKKNNGDYFWTIQGYFRFNLLFDSSLVLKSIENQWDTERRVLYKGWKFSEYPQSIHSKGYLIPGHSLVICKSSVYKDTTIYRIQRKKLLRYGYITEVEKIRVKGKLFSKTKTSICTKCTYRLPVKVKTKTNYRRFH